MASEKHSTTPRIILHGGAGNITRSNLPPAAQTPYRRALLTILHAARAQLLLPDASALDVATAAVAQLEDHALFNAGRGAVFTTAGTHELEASVMVSRGLRKRGVGVMGVRRARNPVRLAREVLVRGEEGGGGGGAQGHVQLAGETCDRLAGEWGLEVARPSYFWTRKRWGEHRRGLGLGDDGEAYWRGRRRADEGWEDAGEGVGSEEMWDGREYLPQGTVGAVVMDAQGTVCVATSTGGITNKLPGRIGDTPTLGAGFWAEEWQEMHSVAVPTTERAAESLAGMFSDCIPGLSGYMSLPPPREEKPQQLRQIRAAAMSGTGNGDSFLRLAAVRTAAAIARFSCTSDRRISLQEAVTQVAGPQGMLQQSAEDRWLKTGEGEGGIIGIEMIGGEGRIVYDFNCGGMFRVYFDDEGKARFGVFRDNDVSVT